MTEPRPNVPRRTDRDPRLRQGLTSLTLAALLIVVGSTSSRVFPPDTQYVVWLFLFGASLFAADAAVTMTRLPAADAALDERRDDAANPWRVAFALAFVITLFAAARTGSSFVTSTAMLLAVIAAGVFLYRRRFFGSLRDVLRPAPGATRIRRALELKDHESLAKLIEERTTEETDPARRDTLLLSLGALHVMRGEYDEAIATFDRIDRAAHTGRVEMGIVVDLNVASAYLAKGDYDAAERRLTRIDAGALPAEFRVAYDINRSALLVGSGRDDEAIRFLDGLALDQVPERSRFPLLRDLAEALARRGTDGDRTRALETALRCVEIEDGPQGLNAMALVLIARREYAQASTRLEEALARSADGRENRRVLAETLYHLGEVASAAGESERRRDLFRRASEVRGGGRFALLAAKALEERPA